MDKLLQYFPFISIEASLGALIVGLLAIDLLASKQISERIIPKISLGGLLLIFFLEIPFLWEKDGILFQHAYILDKFALFFKAFFLLSGFFLIGICRQYQKRLEAGTNAFFILLMTTLLGACCLVSAYNFLAFFISIELMTISLYILTAYLKSDSRSTEAGVKYLVMGAFSSAIMLYGISFIYGITGSLSFEKVSSAIQAMPHLNFLLAAGFFLLIAGIGFKISAFPFQLWVPDVYEGAPTPITAFLSVVSKAAGFAVLLRILFSVMGQSLGAMWTTLAALLAAATLLYGNLGALPQVQGNIKRLLGFSSIGHAGYLLMGVASGSALGASAILYYLTAYGLANLTIFFVVVSASDRNESIESLRGLFSRSPILGASIFVAVLSLAGVPPLAGFFGKFLIIQAVVEKKMLWLAFVGAINIVISLYYYLMIVKTVYVDKSDGSPIHVSPSARWSLITLTALIILLGVFQEPLLNLIQQAISL